MLLLIEVLSINVESTVTPIVVPMIPTYSLLQYPAVVTSSPLANLSYKYVDHIVLVSHMQTMGSWSTASSTPGRGFAIANLSRSSLELEVNISLPINSMTFAGLAMGRSTVGVESRYSSSYLRLPMSIREADLYAYMNYSLDLCKAYACLLSLNILVGTAKGEHIIMLPLHYTDLGKLNNITKLYSLSTIDIKTLDLKEGFEKIEATIYLTEIAVNRGKATYIVLPHNFSSIKSGVFIDVTNLVVSVTLSALGENEPYIHGIEIALLVFALKNTSSAVHATVYQMYIAALPPNTPLDLAQTVLLNREVKLRPETTTTTITLTITTTRTVYHLITEVEKHTFQYLTTTIETITNVTTFTNTKSTYIDRMLITTVSILISFLVALIVFIKVIGR